MFQKIMAFSLISLLDSIPEYIRVLRAFVINACSDFDGQWSVDKCYFKQQRIYLLKAIETKAVSCNCRIIFSRYVAEVILSPL